VRWSAVGALFQQSAAKERPREETTNTKSNIFGPVTSIEMVILVPLGLRGRINCLVHRRKLNQKGKSILEGQVNVRTGPRTSHHKFRQLVHKVLENLELERKAIFFNRTRSSSRLVLCSTSATQESLPPAGCIAPQSSCQSPFLHRPMYSIA
jgi:hypothetical protein